MKIQCHARLALVLFVLVSAGARAGTDGDGVGDAVDVDVDGDRLIEIATLAELNLVRNSLDGTSLDGDSTGCSQGSTPAPCIGYELINDLDFDTDGDGDVDADDAFWNGGAGWVPIGDSTTPFTAVFEGNGWRISNLFVDNDTLDAVGLFGVVNDAEVRNLTLDGDYMALTGAGCNCLWSVGAVAGLVEGSSTFENLTTAGSLSGRLVGGIVGRIAEPLGSATVLMNGVSSSADISASLGGTVGGLIGRQERPVNLLNSFFTGTATGGTVGGLIGNTRNLVSIDRSYSRGVLGPANTAGGLIGRLNGGQLSTITNSFAAGATTAFGDAGGLVGAESGGSFSITNSLAYTAVSGGGDIGGLVGEVGASSVIPSTDSFWDITATGVGTDASTGGVGAGSTALRCAVQADDICSGSAIYSNWSESVWDFGTSYQYPTLIISGVAQRDSDADGIFDVADPDDDNDTIPDASDNCPHDADAVENTNFDGDQFCDVNDPDDDNDGTPDVSDAFPFDEAEQIDTDNDGIGNNADPDDDNDTVLDDLDNCSLTENSGQEDADSDGHGDACDVDANGNGLVDIASLAELDAIRGDLSGASRSGNTTGCGDGAAVLLCAGFELLANLDFDTNGDGDIDADDAYWNGGLGWIPVGTNTEPFTGLFEGNNFEVRNLYVRNTSASAFGGLLGRSDGATLRNLELTGPAAYVEVGSAGYAGALIGRAETGTLISNVTTSVPVTGASQAYVGGVAGALRSTGSITGAVATGAVTNGRALGGLIGELRASTVQLSQAAGAVENAVSGPAGGLVGLAAEGSTIADSSASGSITSTTDDAGGLVGESSDTSLTDVQASGDVTTNTDSAATGGLIGRSISDTITRGNSSGQVTAARWYSPIGGLIGIALGSEVSLSAATGNVTAENFAAEAGGLVGAAAQASTISDSFATGAVTSLVGAGSTGGLVGTLANATLTRTYATGTVIDGASADTGGLVGLLGNQGAIIDSFATGNVSSGSTSNSAGLVGESECCATVTRAYSTGTARVGGLVSMGAGLTVSDSYWDMDTSGLEFSDGGIGKTTRQLTCVIEPATDCEGGNQPFLSWDSAVWDFGNASQYPVLIINGIAHRDTDGDGSFDAIDPDDDNDGIADAVDNCVFDPDAANTNFDADTLCDFNDPDDDNDTINDGDELNVGLDPFNAADAAGDIDGDGFSTIAEARVGSSPFNANITPFNVGAGLNNWVSNGPPDGTERVYDLALRADGEAVFAAVFSAPDGLVSTRNAGLTWEASAPDTFGNSMFSVTFHPTDPLVGYAGAQGDVYKTTDGGVTWAATNVGESGHFDSIQINPQNPSILYASSFNRGVFKSVDAGGSWTMMNTGLPGAAPEEPNDPDTTALTLSPSAPDTLYVASRYPGTLGIFKSIDGGQNWAPSVGGDLTPDTQIRAIAVHPTNPAVVYAIASFGGGLFRSDDSGATWVQVAEIGGGWTVRFNPQRHSEIYVGTTPEPQRSIDGGQSWEALPPVASNAFYDFLNGPAGSSVLYLATESLSVQAMELATNLSVSLAVVADSDPVIAGGTVTYQLTVANEGPYGEAAAGVQVSLPAGLAYQGASPSQGICQSSDGAVNCALGALHSGAQATVDITVQALVEAELDISANVSGDLSELDASDNSRELLVSVVANVDTDGDGVVDFFDAFPDDPAESADRDGDGIGDNTDVFPDDPAEALDPDDDGVGSNADNCPDISNADQADEDGNGTGDACEMLGSPVLRLIIQMRAANGSRS